jgi:hypothetical protein
MNIKEMDDKQLMSEYLSFNNDCFSSQDVLMREMVAIELDRRGVEIVEKKCISFYKDGEEVEME